MKKICLLFVIIFLLCNIVFAESYSYINRTVNENLNAEPDFGPFMQELQRSIKANWQPPIDYRAKRVTLLFEIAKNGSLQACRVLKSSGFQQVDEAAINAVKASAPFKSLPSEFKGKSIEVEFTFDFNVFR